ncbi:hypothetical protein SAMD00079811_58320 [Scytonema sp. HK-05]|nr:hypothetical protein SAMD00079811_58320 [Scytonema sp. HK-05]
MKFTLFKAFKPLNLLRSVEKFTRFIIQAPTRCAQIQNSTREIQKRINPDYFLILN